jgi:hypothetical protein
MTVEQRFTFINPTHMFTPDRPDPEADDEVILFEVPSTGGLVALNPMTAHLDLIVGGAVGVATRLAHGTANQYLQINSDASAIAWVTAITTVNPMSAAADVIVGGVDGAPARLAKGTAGQALCMNGAATAQEWATINPMSAAADMIVGGVSGAVTRLAKGTAFQALRMNSGATAQEWYTPNPKASKSAVNLHVGAQHTAVLSGLAADTFIPTHVVVQCSNAEGMTGDAQITVGTAAGGTQILGATPLTGLTAQNGFIVIPVASQVYGALAANATLHFEITTIDTTVTATGIVTIKGTTL